MFQDESEILIVRSLDFLFTNLTVLELLPYRRCIPARLSSLRAKARSFQIGVLSEFLTQITDERVMRLHEVNK
ncbi:hypothetical protein BRD02_03430 [Halobacteriales archaeon QS_8_69_73]|nr:MAG: hypothetical protein BRD02_03430 [Halobacteriales archaeon QS_8_69_73]